MYYAAIVVDAWTGCSAKVAERLPSREDAEGAARDVAEKCPTKMYPAIVTISTHKGLVGMDYLEPGVCPSLTLQESSVAVEKALMRAGGDW